MNKPEGTIKFALKAGKKYSFCTCGESKKIPFCDGSHKEINVQKGTEFKSFKIAPANDAVVELFCSTWPQA